MYHEVYLAYFLQVVTLMELRTNKWMDEYLVALLCGLICGHFPAVCSFNDACKKEATERHHRPSFAILRTRGLDIQVLLNLWQSHLADKQHLKKKFTCYLVIPFRVTILLFSQVEH